MFAHNTRLLMLNSPDEYITRVPITVSVPQFFLAAGAADTGDVQAAEIFRQELLLRDANVPLVVIPGGGHQAKVWRAALTPMFEWMTPQLAASGECSSRCALERQAPQGASISRSSARLSCESRSRPPEAVADRRYTQLAPCNPQ